MRYSILLLLAVFLLMGCNQGENKSVKMINDTYHTIPTGYTASTAVKRKTREEREENYKKELALAKLKTEENLQLAKIEAEAKEKVKRIESEAEKEKVIAAKEVHLQAQQTQKEIAASKEKRLVQTNEKDFFFYLIVTAMVAGVILIALLVWYLIHRKNKLVEAKMHEDKLKHDAMMQAAAQHHEKVGRMLEIIADEGANELVRRDLVGILKEQTMSQNLIAYEPDEVETEAEVEAEADEGEDSEKKSKR
ncbi:MAG TPA: hypothetical protein ENK77_00850 [Epsilonproteobacteria bacterium]|nr:hypothetical protein [Campylobacterota bacterium]